MIFFSGEQDAMNGLKRELACNFFSQHMIVIIFMFMEMELHNHYRIGIGNKYQVMIQNTRNPQYQFK